MESTRITQEKTYSYFLNDDYIYCITNDNSTRDDDFKGTLVKVDLNSLESTTIYDGASVNGLNVKDNTLYFINGNDEDRLYTIDKDGNNIGIITQDDYVIDPIIIDDTLYYANCDSEFYTEGFVMCKLDGSGKLDL